jgi:S-adenosylhomocysteine hydrolase
VREQSLSTQDDVASALNVHYDIPTYAIRARIVTRISVISTPCSTRNRT